MLPWTSSTRRDTVMQCGLHKSTIEHVNFLNKEMATMALRDQWMVLPYALIRDMATLWISPIGIVPQHERCPHTIVDYSFSKVNANTMPLAQSKSMQFSHTLPQLLQKIVHADLQHGSVYMSKVDVTNGFYHKGMCIRDILSLGMAFPPAPDGMLLVAFPLISPMGWVENPPWFTMAMETSADLAKAAFATNYHPTLHCLAAAAAGINPVLPPMSPLLPHAPVNKLQV
jgi:hypothetical protein